MFMYRVEDKFGCSENEMLLLESRVKAVTHPDAYSDNGSYRITSLYFDNCYDSHLADTEDGVDERKKYRIRIYNGSTAVIKLEVKYKRYNRIFKRSRTISIDTAEKLINGECAQDPEPGTDSPVTMFNLALRHDLLRPRIVVEYDRSAYVFEPGGVRITFDRDIRCSGNTAGFLDDTCSFRMINDMDRVVEVKYDEYIPGFIEGVLENGNMIQTSCSKYRLCREYEQEHMEVYRCP